MADTVAPKIVKIGDARIKFPGHLADEVIGNLIQQQGAPPAPDTPPYVQAPTPPSPKQIFSEHLRGYYPKLESLPPDAPLSQRAETLAGEFVYGGLSAIPKAAQGTMREAERQAGGMPPSEEGALQTTKLVGSVMGPTPLRFGKAAPKGLPAPVRPPEPLPTPTVPPRPRVDPSATLRAAKQLETGTTGSSQSRLLDAAKEVETGTQLDFGEVGRRRAAQRRAAPPEPRPAAPDDVSPVEPRPMAPTPDEVRPPGPARPDFEGMNADELRAYAVDQASRAAPIQSKQSWRDVLASKTLAFERSKDPALQRLGTSGRTQELQHRGFRTEQLAQAAPELGAVRTPQDKALVALLQNQPVTPEILADVGRTHPHVVKAYQVLKTRFDAIADEAGLPMSNRVADYFPRLFDESQLKAASMDFTTPRLLSQLQRVPETIKPFFEYARRGAPGYRLDPHAAYELYVKKLADKRYVEPFLREANTLVPQMDPMYRKMAYEYVSKFGRPQYRDRMEQVAEGIRTVQFYSKLGGNFRWPLVNWAMGRGATASHFLIEDPASAARAMRIGKVMTNTPEGRAWLTRAGHTGSTFLDDMIGEGQALGKAKNIATMNVQAIERSNRGQAYFGELWRQLGKPDPESFRALLREDFQTPSGRIPPAAREAADRVVEQTQGLYGSAFDPKWLNRPGWRFMTQFIGTPAKIVYGLGGGGKPQKLFTLALGSQAVAELADALGVDVRHALGMGLNITGFIKDLQEGKSIGEAAWTNAPPNQFMQDKGGIFSFALAPITQLPRTAARLWENDWSLPGAGERGLEAALGEFTLPNRIYKAYRDVEMGGSWRDAARQIGGYPAEATTIRAQARNYYQAGQTEKARDLIRQYNQAHPDAPISVDPDVRRDLSRESRDRERTKEREEREKPREQRKREAHPPHVRPALRPPLPWFGAP